MNTAITKAEAIESRNVSALTHSLRRELSLGVANIPDELKQFKGWLCWRTTQIDSTTGKFNKIPVYPASGEYRSGEHGSPEDVVSLGSFEQAMAAIDADASLAGIGFATLACFGIVALDADKCVESGALRADVAELTDATYCEVSPSGTGVRAFWRGAARNAKNHEAGIELFNTTGFVTITGNRRDNFYRIFGGGVLPALNDAMRFKLESLTDSPGARTGPSASDQLREGAKQDLKLQAIRAAGLYERDMRAGKHSIKCPFEDEHSDPDRAGGDGDTAYFQPHTNGYKKGSIYCMHAHCSNRTQREYWQIIGYDENRESVHGMFKSIDDWPDPLPLPDLPPVPKFDLDLLPDAFQPWIADVSERMQIAPDIPAIGAITALSIAIGRRVQIKPKQHDDWTVIPNLWGVVVAPAGFMKSPALSEVLKPLHKLEHQANQDYELAMDTWSIEKTKIALANDAAKATARQNLKKDPKSEIAALLTEPDEPIPIRYIVNNFSLEALGEVLIGNPDGVLAFNDELYGLLKMADKPGNEELQSFLLTGWNGYGHFTFDRIGRGKRHLDAVCLSVLGGIQPSRLVEYLLGGGYGGALENGFINRFQLLTWPDQSNEWKLIDREPNYAAREAYDGVFERVTNGSPFPNLESPECSTSVRVRNFDGEAQQVFNKWFEQNELLIRGDTLPPVVASHLSKFRSLVPSLALIFSVADGVTGDVPVRYVRQAIGWADYLRPHAERAFACMTRPDTAHARALLAKIKSGDVPDNFSSRDVYRKEWSMLGNRDAVEKAVATLVDHDYLQRVDNPTTSKGGRTSANYRINPKTLQ